MDEPRTRRWPYRSLPLPEGKTMPHRIETPWRVHARKDVFIHRPWLKLSVETVEVSDRRIVDDYYQLELPDFANIFAETQEGRVVVIYQYKHGPRQTSLTLPGGQLEPGEQPLQAARRELMEETGYQAVRWRHLGSYMVNGNLGCGRGHFFMASGAWQSQPPDGRDLENMDIKLLEHPELSAAIQNGEVILLNHMAAITMALRSRQGDGGDDDALTNL